MKRKINKNTSSAYIAITSVLTVAVFLVSVSLTATLLSISEGQMSLSDQEQFKSQNLAEACVAEALLFLAENSSLPTTVSLSGGSCQIVNQSNSGDQWQFELSASANTLQETVSSLELVVLRDSAQKRISIISWKEI